MGSYNGKLKWAKCLSVEIYWLLITPPHNSL